MRSSLEGNSSARSVRLLTIGVIMTISIYGLMNCYHGVVLNRIVESYQLTGSLQGLTPSLINVGAVVAFLTAPLLQGRVKKTTLLLIGAGIIVLSFFLLGAGRVITALVFASLLTGVGFGWVDANCNAVMVDLHHDDSAKYLGFLHGGFGVGALIAPILITALLTFNDWHAVSYIFGVILAITAVVFILLLSAAKKGVPAPVAEPKLTLAGVKSFLFHRKNVLMLVCIMLYSVSQAGFLVWIVRYMTLQYNAESLGSVALSLYWVFGTISRIFAPRLKIRPLVLFLLGVVLTCVFQTIGVLSGSAIVMCIAGAATGLVSGHCVPMILSVANADNPGNSSLISSSFLVSIYATNSISSLFMGALASWTNLNVMMMLPAVSAAFAAVVVGIILREERAKNSAALA